ncbi:MAG TPA: thermonuclease family protein, partial [Thermodesulfobacteriota bacterium]|nr:thermonuclease family protein [Thermodesulfobacteriota bacterium]
MRRPVPPDSPGPRRGVVRLRRTLLAVGSAAAALAALVLTLVPSWRPWPAARTLRATVVAVVDGDTIEVRLADGRRATVRLIGVDAPEQHDSPKLDRDAARSGLDKATIRAMGRLAADYTRRRLEGRTVELELDAETHDRYGRLLAYVWLPGDVLFNAELLREGYAQLLTVPPNVKYADRFVALQREARAAGRGLWGEGLAGRRLAGGTAVG